MQQPAVADKQETREPPVQAQQHALELEGDFFPLDVVDEYDPFQPNDYEAVLRDREALRQEEERLAELRRRFDDHRTSGEQRAQPLGYSGERERGSPTAEPPLDRERSVGGEQQPEIGRGRGGRMDILPAWMKKQQQQQPQPEGGDAASSSSVGPSSLRASASASSESLGVAPQSAAAADGGGGFSCSSHGPESGIGAKMMAKMGYTSGKGLGRDESGITAPLLHMKTGVRSGVIRVGDAADAAAAAATMSPSGGAGDAQSSHRGRAGGVLLSTVGGDEQTESASVAPSISRVLLLRNMIGRGEVDDDLEAEVKEELSKYGDVRAVFVFECPGADVPEEEAVRIFVQFSTVDAAQRARSDLHGRFFGGRSVMADFFDELKFARFEFAPH